VALEAAAPCGDAARAERWLAKMDGRGSVVADVRTYTAVIDACAKTRDAAGAERGGGGWRRWTRRAWSRTG